MRDFERIFGHKKLSRESCFAVADLDEWACFELTDSRKKRFHWLVGLVFEVNWRLVVEGAVSALAIVEDFDVIEDGGAGLSAGIEVGAVHQFHFEGAPEAFHGGIIVAVAFAAHGSNEFSLGQSLAVMAGRVLHATVGVEEELGWGLTMLQRHAQGG